MIGHNNRYNMLLCLDKYAIIVDTSFYAAQVEGPAPIATLGRGRDSYGIYLLYIIHSLTDATKILL